MHDKLKNVCAELGVCNLTDYKTIMDKLLQSIIKSCTRLASKL